MFMSIGKRIKAAREAKGWSQGRLADAVGKSQSAISSWEVDRNEPTRTDVKRIANLLGIPLHQLENLPGLALDERMVIDVPVLSWVSAGAMADIGSVDAATAELEIPIADLPPGDYFATDVVGDSMDRISPEGSRIIVNAADKQLIAGRAYVFSVRGETTYKFFQPRPVPRLEPFSTNPMNKTIFLDQRETWHVVGRVVRSIFDLR